MDWFGRLKIGRGQHINDMSEKDFTMEVMILRKLLKWTLSLLENNKMVGQAPPYKLKPVTVYPTNTILIRFDKARSPFD